MDFKNVRHLREILTTDAEGVTTSTMQYSSQNASHFRPKFTAVPFQDQARARELYLRWGGKRPEGWQIGITVSLPNRTGLAGLGRISTAGRQAVSVSDTSLPPAGAPTSTGEKSRARNRSTGG